jgi:hypothetical protein
MKRGRQLLASLADFIIMKKVRYLRVGGLVIGSVNPTGEAACISIGLYTFIHNSTVRHDFSE